MSWVLVIWEQKILTLMVKKNLIVSNLGMRGLTFENFLIILCGVTKYNGMTKAVSGWLPTTSIKMEIQAILARGTSGFNFFENKEMEMEKARRI